MITQLTLAHRGVLNICLTTLCLLVLLSATAKAESPARSAADFASGDGNVIYLAAAIGLPLVRDGKLGTTHFLRVTDSLAVSMAIAESLKYLVREERPNHEGHDSFPSGHATAAFSVATAEAQFHPHEALFWYLGAAAIGQSRVRLQDHYEHDVLAGALLGWGMTKLELSTPHGIILQPFIAPAQHAAGITVTAPLK